LRRKDFLQTANQSEESKGGIKKVRPGVAKLKQNKENGREKQRKQDAGDANSGTEFTKSSYAKASLSDGAF
jgi:hypothetical protein